MCTLLVIFVINQQHAHKKGTNLKGYFTPVLVPFNTILGRYPM